MTELVDIHSIQNEIVITERKVTTEWKIREIHESHENQFVRVDIELGPFVEETRPNGEVLRRGSSSRGILAWQGAEYLAIRDTWNNDDLIAKIKEIIDVAPAAPAV